jgi:hypothetical protein
MPSQRGPAATAPVTHDRFTMHAYALAHFACQDFKKIPKINFALLIKRKLNAFKRAI